MKLELSIHGLKLKNVAGLGKGTSDPFAVATVLATTADAEALVLGRTETIKNQLNPSWAKVFTFDHELGQTKKVAINVFDEVRKGENIAMGSAVFDIDEVLAARGNTKAKKLKGGGMIFAAVRKSQGSGVFRLQMKGQKLKNVEGLFSKSDPFFELSRKVNSAGGLTWDNVYRSKEIHNNLNPEWEPAAIEMSILCGGDMDLPILIEVFDHESNGKHKPMGKTEMSVRGLQAAAKSGEGIKLKQKNKDVGTLIVVSAEVSGAQPPASAPDEQELANSLAANANVTAPQSPAAPMIVPAPPAVVPIPPPSVVQSAYTPTAPPGIYDTSDQSQQPDFVDYVSGGCELNVTVAIDFTGSNGDPRKPGTLHYLGGPERNDYQKAIAAIVSILSKYDSDQKFPVVGFGAKYGGIVRHCFQCGQTAEAQGLRGVLDAYQQVFSSGLIMSGPTVFDEVIESAAARAKQSLVQAQQQKGQQAYTILLIVTDGAVTDPNATVAALERASDAPMSIVIVGVGNADFSTMQFLDDFNSKAPGRRDIVQFVEFNRHKHSSASLTSETLREIPNQLTGYFQSRGIAAMPAIQRTDSTLSYDEAEDEIDLSLDIKEEEIVITGGGTSFVDGFNATR